MYYLSVLFNVADSETIAVLNLLFITLYDAECSYIFCAW